MGKQSSVSRGPRGNDKTAEGEELFAAIVVFEHDKIVFADDEVETNCWSVQGSELFESINRQVKPSRSISKREASNNGLSETAAATISKRCSLSSIPAFLCGG